MVIAMDKPKVSLSFAKKIEKKNLQSSALHSESSLVDDGSQKHSISSFDKNSTVPVPLKLEDQLVIPLIGSTREDLFKKFNSNSSKVPVKTEELPAKDSMSLDELAAAAIIEESKIKMEKFHGQESEYSTIELDVSDSQGLMEIGTVSTPEDYEKVAVESYGAALLRGMGWKKSEGVGKNNKSVVNIVEPTSKSLGTTRQKTNEEEGKIVEEEVEELKKGCFALIHSGRNRGTYGTVELVDEDYLLIKPSRGDKVLREVELNVRAVSAKEFKEFSRVINKDVYDQYKAEELKKKEDKLREIALKKRLSEDSKKSKSERENSKERKRTSDQRYDDSGKRRNRDYNNHKDDNDEPHEEEYKYKKDNYSSKYKNGVERSLQDKDLKRYSSKEDHTKHKSKETDKLERTYGESINKNTSNNSLSKNKIGNILLEKETKFSTKCEIGSSIPTRPWATENLRVRIIDKKYIGGKYHKQKVIIRSVDTMETASCITEDGKMLWDVNLCNIETVIPKQSSSLVLILNGTYKGQKGKILELHKEKERATVQLLTDSSIIVKLIFDDICEFINR